MKLTELYFIPTVTSPPPIPLEGSFPNQGMDRRKQFTIVKIQLARKQYKGQHQQGYMI
jgi:hypothetical protein